jgi:hypothetical protein
LLRRLLVPLMVGLLAASAVAPCQAFAPAKAQAVAAPLDPCREKALSQAPCCCAQLACQVLLEPAASVGHPILRQEETQRFRVSSLADGRSFRPDVPPPRALL